MFERAGGHVSKLHRICWELICGCIWVNFQDKKKGNKNREKVINIKAPWMSSVLNDSKEDHFTRRDSAVANPVEL